MIRDLELNILEILFNDARTPVDQIAVMTGHSEEEVEAVIRSLEAQKIIVKYPALINWDKLDQEQVEALIEVRVTPQRDEGFDAIAERIYRFEEVKSVYLMSGGFDLCLIVEGHTMRDVAYFVAEKLATIDGVASTATHFVLQRYKDGGIVFDNEETDKRGNDW